MRVNPALRLSAFIISATLIGACKDTTAPSNELLAPPSIAADAAAGEAPAREVPADVPDLSEAHGTHFSAATLSAALSSAVNPVTITGFTELGGHFQSAVRSAAQQGFPTEGSSYLVFSSGDARTPGTDATYVICETVAPFGQLCDVGGLRVSIAVPSAASELRFDYRYWSTESGNFFEDPFRVFVEVAGAAPTQVVQATLTSEFGGNKTFGGLGFGPMRQAVINVIAYRGQTIMLRFQASDRSDRIVPSGAFVDNLTFGVLNTGPSITAPADLTFDNDAGVCEATVALLGEPTVTDDGAYEVGVPTRSDGSAFDAPYPVGTTTVTWTVTDDAGLSDSDEQTVTVSDAEAPTIAAPADITVTTDAGQPHATVNLPPATAADNCPGVTVNDPPSATYPIGPTTVTYIATDAVGLSASATTTVTVVDEEDPVLTIPSSFEIDATMPGGAVVDFAYSATDNSGDVSVTCNRASGSIFAIGATTVTCTATDGSDNSTQGSFTVTVIGARAQLEDLIARVTALALQNGTSQPLLNMLGTALRDPGANSPDVACIKLGDFVFKMQDHKAVASILQTTIDTMIADAKQIQRVMGCSQ